MEPINDEHRPFFCQFETNAFLSFFEEGHFANHGAELLWPFVAGDFSSQRLESSTVSTGEDYRPLVFEFPGDSFIGAASANPVSRDRVLI